MTRKVVFAWLTVAVLVVVAVHFLQFRGSVPDFVRASGGGTLLDVKPSFSSEEIYSRLGGYGEAGRKNYAFRNVTTDIILPLSVFPFLFLLMRSAVKRLRPSRLLSALLLALPICYVVFDLAENGLVLALLAHYPNRLHVIPVVLPFVTVIKRAASLLALTVPLAIFLILLVRDRRAALASSP